MQIHNVIGMRYPAETIGSRMTENYIAISPTATVKEAMSTVVRQAADMMKAI